MPDRFDFACKLAKQTGEILLEGFHQEITPRFKGEIDLVTDYDFKAERFLIDAIRQSFPEDGILAEEGGRINGTSGQWVIDPLDGTVNFAHGVPMFTVSIAWVDIRGPKLGVIHDPVHGELFRAARGLGAQLNGSPISVSNTPVLDQSLLVTGFPYDIRENPDNNLDHYTDLSLRSLGVRRLGSAALDLAYVAAGRFDAYWELRLFPWDMAAGVLLVKEAGGEVSRAEGAGDIFAEPISLLASNGHIHAEMLEALGRGQNLEG
jgi:myo-inositol-1(or 4)-monophosphatase